MSGTNNRIILVDGARERLLAAGETIKGLDIFIEGNDNLIRIDAATVFDASIFRIRANRSKILIEAGPSKVHLIVEAWGGDNQSFSWGKGSDTSWIINAYLCEEGSSISVGEACMFAGEISLWSGDAHAIFDKKTGALLNKGPAALTIGDHCWIGQAVRITKKAAIPSHSIVGGGAVVTRPFETPFTVLAGNPARVVREGVTWTRDNPARAPQSLPPEA